MLKSEKKGTNLFKAILVRCFGILFGLVSLAYSQDSVDVTIPNSTGEPDSTVIIPIEVSSLTDRNVIAYQTIITFDENVLDAVGASIDGALTETFGSPTVNTQTNGQIVLGGFGTSPLIGSGTLVNLIFSVAGSPGQSTELQFSQFIFNNGDPPANTQGGTLTVDSPVPVELTSFSAEVINNSVVLKWMTARGSNNFGFEIERSVNAKVFHKIGFVKNGGATSIPQEYEFCDKVNKLGIYYYRLKQIDTDGSFENTDILRVEVISPGDFFLAQNYPNPFNPETNIRFDVPNMNAGANVRLLIYNVTGQLVRVLVDESKQPGSHEVVWDGTDDHGDQVTSGVYFYKMTSGDFESTHKLLIIK